MDDPNERINERIARLFDHLGEKHNEVAELLQSSTDPKHAHGNKALAKAERISARTCVRVAASIRTRLNEEGTAIKVGRTPAKLQNSAKKRSKKKR
jgi:hypothetical protein